MESVSKARVIELARRLWKMRGELTVEEIDGAFYWHICRGYLIDRLKELLAQESMAGETDRLDRARHLWDHMFEMESFAPGVRDWLEQEKPPMMRDPLFSWYSRRPSNVPCIQPGWVTRTSGIWMFLGVRSSWWRGSDVEQAIRERASQVQDEHHDLLIRNDSSRLMAEEDVIFVDLKLYRRNELQIESDWDEIPSGDPRWLTVESPVVLCAVQYPFPPDGVIAAIYDAVAIRERGWHQELYGAGSSADTTIEVAIRTWTMGLLTRAGLSSHEVSRITEPIFLQPVTQQGFGEQRKELVRRVPEAEEFVFQRRRRAKQVE